MVSMKVKNLILIIMRSKKRKIENHIDFMEYMIQVKSNETPFGTRKGMFYFRKQIEVANKKLKSINH